MHEQPNPFFLTKIRQKNAREWGMLRPSISLTSARNMTLATSSSLQVK
jgi:hypothetical protein